MSSDNEERERIREALEEGQLSPDEAAATWSGDNASIVRQAAAIVAKLRQP